MTSAFWSGWALPVREATGLSVTCEQSKRNFEVCGELYVKQKEKKSFKLIVETQIFVCDL